MVLLLDSAFPLVWRSPSSLQFGVDELRLVLHEVDDADERMISVLLRGASPGALALAAHDCGMDGVRLAVLLSRLSSVLVRPTAARTPRRGGAPFAERWRVALDSPCAIGSTVRSLLQRHGIPCEQLETRPTSRRRRDDVRAADHTSDVALAVIVGDYALAPARTRRWLHEDIPHLLVTIGDRTARIGPLVTPGTGPCHHCLELARTDFDPAWPTLAAQLFTRSAVARTPVVTAEVSTIIVRTVQAALRLGPAAVLHGESVSVDARTGSRARFSHSRHPKCRCSIPAESATAFALKIGQNRARTN